MKRACPHAKAFRQLVNMSPKAIRTWGKDPRARLASFTSTRRRLPRVAELKAKPVAKWTLADCKLAGRVVSFNTRMTGVVKKHGCTKKAVISLRNWGRAAPGCAVPKLGGLLDRMAAKEHREHPWTTKAQARRIAQDHLRKRR